MSQSTDQKLAILKQISTQFPYSTLSDDEFEELFRESQLVKYEMGQRILRPDEIPDRLSIVVKGRVRLLSNPDQHDHPVTISMRGSGQLIGWASLLSGSPCEWVTASEPSVVVSFRSDLFLKLIYSSKEFAQSFSHLVSLHEAIKVASNAYKNIANKPSDWLGRVLEVSSKIKVVTVSASQNLDFLPNNFDWLVSNQLLIDQGVSPFISKNTVLPVVNGYRLGYRLIGFPKNMFDPEFRSLNAPSNLLSLATNAVDSPGTSLQALGIVEDDLPDSDDNFPILMAKGQLKQTLAVCEMLALYEQTPFRKDVVSKLLEQHFARQKPLSVELLAKVSEYLGLNCQLSSVETKYISSLEGPALSVVNNIPVLIYKVNSNAVIIGNPSLGLQRIPFAKFSQDVGEKLKFALPRRVSTTPRSRFGFNWFVPLIIKYKKSLVLVFVASLLAQLFGLAIPLLIQQIIDKVLSQEI